jgi:hypothetical protein
MGDIPNSNHLAKKVSGSIIANITKTAHRNIPISRAGMRCRRTATNTTAKTDQTRIPQNDNSPAMANNGCRCHKLNPAICGPRVHVQTVFSQPTLPARSKANGAQMSHQTFIQSDRFPVGASSRSSIEKVYLPPVGMSLSG